MEIKTPIDMKTLIKNSYFETYDKIKLIKNHRDDLINFKKVLCKFIM